MWETTDKTAFVKDDTFAVVRCVEHAIGHVPAEPKKEVKNGQPAKSG